MIHKIFTFYDEKAEAYLPVFMMHAPAMARRTFSDMVNDLGHQFGKHPEDYTLYEIGEFDDAVGHLMAHGKSKVIATGLEVRSNSPSWIEPGTTDSIMKQGVKRA